MFLFERNVPFGIEPAAVPGRSEVRDSCRFQAVHSLSELPILEEEDPYLEKPSNPGE